MLSSHTQVTAEQMDVCVAGMAQKSMARAGKMKWVSDCWTNPHDCLILCLLIPRVPCPGNGFGSVAFTEVLQGWANTELFAKDSKGFSSSVDESMGSISTSTVREQVTTWLDVPSHC